MEETTQYDETINQTETIEWINQRKGILCLKSNEGQTRIVHIKELNMSNKERRELKNGMLISNQKEDETEWDII
jgi:hypothetical protein